MHTSLVETAWMTAEIEPYKVRQMKPIFSLIGKSNKKRIAALQTDRRTDDDSIMPIADHTA